MVDRVYMIDKNTPTKTWAWHPTTSPVGTVEQASVFQSSLRDSVDRSHPVPSDESLGYSHFVPPGRY